jgi:hypothetical protein
MQKADDGPRDIINSTNKYTRKGREPEETSRAPQRAAPSGKFVSGGIWSRGKDRCVAR